MFWASEGLVNKEIAAHLGIGITTVIEYLARAMTKLGTRKRGQAIKLWTLDRLARGLPVDHLA